MMTRTITIMLLLLCPLMLAAVEPEWSYLASQKTINQLRVIDGSLYAATDGGLMIVNDIASPPSMYGNTDGLGTTVINDLVSDANGDIWLAGIGRLVKFAPDFSIQFLFMDNDNNLIELLSLADDGDQIWVGTNLGLILFSKTVDGGQIQDSYQLMGSFNPNPQVRKIVLTPDSIYLATNEGFAMADRTVINALKSPSAWKTFDATNLSALSQGVNDLALFDGRIYLGASVALYIFNPITELFSVTPFNPLSGSCYSLELRPDSLIAYCANGLGVVTTSGANMYPLSGISIALHNGVYFGSRQWIGTNGGGMFYQAGLAYSVYPYGGAPGNDVTGAAVSADGTVFGGFGSLPLAYYQNDQWTTIARPRSDRTTNVMVDSLGRGWIGTWGGGLQMLDGDQLTVFDTTNSPLAGNSDNNGGNYVVIRGLDASDRYLFAAAYRSVTDHPIVIADLYNLENASGWTTIGAAEGLTDHFVSTLDYHNGWLAIGTDAGGVYLYYLGPNPFDKSDDFITHYTESSDRLASDIIRIVKFAPDGILFVGTNLGLSVWNPGYEWFDDQTLPGNLGPNVDALEFDSRGNLWVGATNGLGRINLDSEEMEQFTSINSGLLSTSLRSLSYNHATGVLLAATNQGISLIGSLTGPPASDIASGYPFPNPFLIRTGQERLNFTYTENGTINIFTISGDQVIEQSVNIGWDGRNEAGENVASGLYLYTFTSDSGEKHQGKFLLVRD